MDVAIGTSVVGQRGAGLVLGSDGGGSVGVSYLHVLKAYEVSAVARDVFLCHVVEVDGVDLTHVVRGQYAHMVFPLGRGHTSDATVVLVAQLCLLSVSSDAEVLEVNQDLLSDAEEWEKPRSVDAKRQ